MYLLHFNSPDKPANMGQSQKTDNVSKFASERADILPNWEIEKDGKKLTFDVTAPNPDHDPEKDGTDKATSPTLVRRGYAVISEVEDDFEN